MKLKGIDYFPLNCFFEDSVELMIAEYGMKGLGILIRLYQKIYSNGYYLKWDDDVMLMFSRQNGLGVDVVSEVLQCCFKREIFSNEMYLKFNILTSKGIQERFFEIIKRRKEITVNSDYLLVECDENFKNVCKNAKNVCKNAKNVCNSQQSKVKESKVKESKVKESIYRFTRPKQEEIEKYCKDNGYKIDCKRFFDYYTANGWKVGRNPMEDWQATVRTWVSRDVEKNGEKEEPSFDIKLFKDYGDNQSLKYERN